MAYPDLELSLEARNAQSEAGSFLHYKEYKKCIPLLEKLPSGSTDLLMGIFHLHGLGVRKDRDAAQKCFSRLRTGQIVYFGNDPSRRLMKCRILSIREDRVLLHAVDALKQLPESFKPSAYFAKKHVPWDRSLLRIELNDSYFKEAFTAELRKTILPTEVVTPENPFCSKKHKVKDTTDKVFLLSLQEYLVYYGLDPLRASRIIWTSTGITTNLTTGLTYTSRKVEVETLYFGKEPKDNDLYGATGQYLRTPGENDSDRSYIVGDYLFYGGKACPDANINLGFKPAFWVSLK